MQSIPAAIADFNPLAESSITTVSAATEAVFAWARDVGQGLDELTAEQRKELLQMVVEEVIIDRNDNVNITLAIPVDSKPTTEDSVSVQTFENVQTLEHSFGGLNRHRKLKYSWGVDLGPFKPGQVIRQ